MRISRTGAYKLGLLTLPLSLVGCGNGEGTVGDGGDGKGSLLEPSAPARNGAAPSPGARTNSAENAAATGELGRALPNDFLSPALNGHGDSTPLDTLGEGRVSLKGQLNNATPQTLQEYALACEDATGIRIPSFNCDAGYEVPEGTVVHNPVGTAINGVPNGSITTTAPGFLHTLTARGSDIWGTADQFYFGVVPSTLIDGAPLVTGDGMLETQVLSLTNTDQYAKAGITMRASNAAGAINVSMVITPSKGAIFQARTTTNGSTTTTEFGGAALTAPAWVRIARTGNSFTGFVSQDRITWNQVGSAVTLTGFTISPWAGIALASHNASATATATFDRLRFIRPFNSSNMKCDAPNVLNGECDPGSRFQVLAQTGDAAAVAHCRKRGLASGHFQDIAVIQYNKANGALCFYQSVTVDQVGTAVPAPSGNPGSFAWWTPTQMASSCPTCHDNGAFIRSPYLVQTGLLPNAADKFDNSYDKPVRLVGTDFLDYRNWYIYTATDPTDTDPLGNPNQNCADCHRLSVNNNSIAGTAASFGVLATASTQSQKNPHSATSPIWMRQGQNVYKGGAWETAKDYQKCAQDFWSGKSSHFDDGNRSNSNCTYSTAPVAQPFEFPSYNKLQIGVTNGTDTTVGTQHTLTVTGDDIYGTTDHFFYSLAGSAGNGMATVKVNSIDSVEPWAKAGIMLRDDISTTAPNVMVELTKSQGAQFQYRLTGGGTTTASTPLSPSTAPKWLRLYRTGSIVSGWVSNDGITYNQVAPAVNTGSTLTKYIGLAASSHSTTNPITAVFDRFSWVDSIDALADTNIGQLNGTKVFTGGNRVVTVAGSDIYGTSDQFFYSFKQITGSTTIITKVNSIGNTHAFAKAGLMIRSSIDANAPHVMVHITPTSGAQFQYRTSVGGSVTSNTPVAAPTPTAIKPVWLMLSRSGNIYTASMSTDNQATWSTVATFTTTAIPSTALVGIAVSSHDAANATTASFGNVLVY